MRFAVLALALCASVFGQSDPTVRFITNQGDIDVTLLPGSAPRTVTNFLNYVNRGDYNGTFFHRSVANFVIQGGGYKWQNNDVALVREDPPVVNEFRVSNTRGTIAMAKLGTGPNTATNQWFFNLANNAANLDNQNGGFTVFGRVANASSLAVMDRIGAVPRYQFQEPFSSIPLVNYTGGQPQERNFVIVSSIVLLNRIQSAGAFGQYAYASPGSWLEIFGNNFAPEPGRTWAGGDFNNGQAPTELDGVRVTVNGVPAYVSYIGPNQINVQLPADIPTGGNVSIVVTKNGTSDPAVQFPIRDRAPGLLAPTSFRVGTRQYVYAAHANGSIVANGQFADLPAAPAQPGETLVFYGVGFGPVSPTNISHAGAIVPGVNQINAPVEFRFNDTPGVVSYAGLVPGLVGLYQFNVVVPDNVATGDVSVTVSVANERAAQTLFLPVQRQ